MASFYDTPNTLIQTPRYGKPQANALDILTQRGLQNSDFGGIEKEARYNFAANQQPSINARFAQFGNNGGSSGQIGANRVASGNLEAQLAGLKSQHGIRELQLGLEPQYDNFLQQEKEGLGSQTLSSLVNYGGQAGLNYYDKKWTAEGLEALEKAREERNKLGGQSGFVDAAQQAKDVGGGTLAGLTAKASGYGIPAAVGAGVGAGTGYLANKAGVPTDANVGLSTGVGTAAAVATAQAVTAGMAGIALGPVLAWGAAAGLSAYGLKKLYNYWNQANPGQENQLENRMAIMQLEGR